MTIFRTFNAQDGPLTARRIETFLRGRIEAGDLTSGAKLPPIREIAWQIGCAPGTVARAYRALVVAGLAHGEVGRGTFVGSGAQADPFPMRAPPPEAVADFSVNSFQMEDASRLLAEALHRSAARVASGAVSLTYQGLEGGRENREAVVPLISRWRSGVTAEDIVVASGAQSLLSAAFLALSETGAGIACDALTYPGVIAAAVATGTKLHPVRMDAQGMCPEALDALCRKVPVSQVFLMPTVQNPTGGAMPAARRAALAEVAARHRLTILEDQVYGFLEKPGRTGFSDLIPERTLLMFSLSKCVAPALRVGYAAGPSVMIRRLASAQNAMQMMVSPVLTDAANWILGLPAFEERLARLREGSARRAAYVAERLPSLSRDTLAGGLAWLSVPEGWTEDGFCAEAEALGVRVSPGRLFAADARTAPGAVRLCLASVPDETRFRAAIDRIAGLCQRPGTRSEFIP